MPRSPREAMIDSALVLFRRRGVADTSLRDVVEHSGVSRGSIYHHFPGGKEELALAATERGGAFIGDLLERLLADADGERAISAFVDYWTSALAAAEFADGCPVAAAAVSPDETASARHAAGRAFARWETLLADALGERGVPPTRAATLATLAIASVEGALLISRAQRDTEPLARVGTELRALLSAVE